MDRSEQKKLKSFIENSSDEELFQSIEYVRKEADLKCLPLILQRWENSRHGPLRESITNLLTDIKDQNAVPYIIKSIERQPNGDLKSDMISVLWQSGLDASEYLSELVSIAADGDYKTAVEIFTVIENFNNTEFTEEEILDSIYEIEEIISEEPDVDKIKILAEIRDAINQLATS